MTDLIKFYGPEGKWGMLKHDGPDVVYTSWRKREDHFHRKMQAWSLSAEVFNDILQRGCTKIVFDIKGEGKIYTTPHAIRSHGIWTSFDDYEEQVFLAEKLWWRETDDRPIGDRWF